MRRLLMAAVGLLVLASLPVGSPHSGSDHLQHISPTFGPLGPGQNQTHHLQFENGSFVAGWVFLVYGTVGVAGDPAGEAPNVSLELRLLFNGTLVRSWTWTAGSWNFHTVTLPYRGEYELALRNPHDFSVSYVFYFDQSCDCLAKTITLPQGIVVFNYPFQTGERASFGVPTLEGWDVEARMATREHDLGVWPDDYDVVQSASHAGKGWLYLNFTAAKSDTHYFFVQALEGARFSTTREEMRVVELTPLLERFAEATSPGPSLALGALVLFAAGSIWSRRR